jgi:predicted RNA-binding protein with EMAP domain
MSFVQNTAPPLNPVFEDAYNYTEVEKLKLENERLNTLLSNNDKILEELENGKKYMINRINNMEDKLNYIVLRLARSAVYLWKFR